MSEVTEPAGTQGAAVQALASLGQAATGEVSAAVLAVLPTHQPAEIYQLQPTQEALPPLNKIVHLAAGVYAACEVIDYEPASLVADGQVMWMETDQVPLLKQLLEDSADLANLPRFEPKKKALDRLGFAAMRVESTGGVALFVQSLRGQQVVARSTKLGVIIRPGVLDVPKGEMVMLTSDFVVALIDRYTFFRNRKAFQQLFGLMEEMRQQAGTTFEVVTAQLRIAGLDQMGAAVTG
ncbi:MAG: hypothetical protein ACRDYB_04750, partial [Acidimicrobiales bacterium]